MIGTSATLYFYTFVIRLCNGAVGCWTVESANHTKSTQLNPPITELITIIIAATTYPEKKKPKKNWEMSKFFTLDIVPTGDVCP